MGGRFAWDLLSGTILRLLLARPGADGQDPAFSLVQLRDARLARMGRPILRRALQCRRHRSVHALADVVRQDDERTGESPLEPVQGIRAVPAPQRIESSQPLLDPDA